MVKAGVFAAGAGLKNSAQAKRIVFDGPGPYALRAGRRRPWRRSPMRVKERSHYGRVERVAMAAVRRSGRQRDDMFPESSFASTARLVRDPGT